MYNYAARLVRVIDGDTVVLDVDMGFTCWRNGDHYRLLRINAPELKDPSGDGVRARDALVAFLEGKALTITTTKADSFGRYLAETWANGVNVSDWMVANGYAVYKSY